LKASSKHIIFKNFLFAFCVIGVFYFASAQDISDTPKDIDYYFSLARKYKNQNKLDVALQNVNKATDFAEKNEDDKGLIDCYHLYSLINLELNKPERSKFYIERANVLLNRVAYPYGSSMNNFVEAAHLFNEKNNFQALEKLNTAKQLSNDRSLLNNITLAEAKINQRLGNYDKAETNYNALIVNTDIYEKEYLSTLGHLGLTKIHFEKKNYKDAAINGEEGLLLAKKNNFFKELLQLNNILTKTYKNIGSFDMALKHNQNLLAIKDSIFNIEKVKVEKKAIDEVNIKTTNKVLEKVQAELLEMEEAMDRSQNTNIIALAILAIISLLAISLYRNNQIKIRTNAILTNANEELQTAKDAAVSAMEAKTNFLSTVSHELRTPLYAVTGLTNLLLEESPKKSQQEHLKSLKFSGDYLLNFINDILQINKIDADKVEPLKIDFSLKKTLKEVLDSLQQSAKENNTVLELDYDERIAPVLMGDAIKISQIFINLVGNAIKFTKNGKVKVIANLLRKEESLTTIYFEVKDNGIGISPEQQKNIFDSFEQGSIQINREYGGTGLGLTIVKSLLGLFGSQIHLKSELGKGSTFSFSMDMTCKDQIIDDLTFEPTKKEFSFKGLHILIVEDNKINQVITKKMLAKKEITSDIANNGYEAVDLAKENTYDAILMDIHMPGISGEEATIRIRKFNKDIPIIALTAISLDDSLENFYAAGCNDVVTKPFKPEVFYQRIGENIFDKKS